MKKILFVVSALAILMGISVSCQKELNNGQAISAGEGTASSLVVTATIADNGTKVSYAEDGTTPNPGLKPTWEENDIIIGFDGDGNTYGYKVTEVNDGKATLVIETSGDYKGSKTSDPVDGTKMYMFYAPGTNPSAISNKSLTVNLANQAKDVVPALMMAESTVTDGSLSLSFSNQTAIIGIKTPTMASASTGYTSIALSGSGINTEVKFDLSGTDGALNASYQTSGTITKTVEFTSDSDKKVTGVTYIVACPLETSANLTFNTNNGEKFTKTGKTMSAANYYYMTPTFGKFNFTVDASNKDVKFAPGNLYYNGTSWGFEAKQYYFRTYDGKGKCDGSGYNSTSGTTSGHWGLFGWVGASSSFSGNEAYGASTSQTNADYGNVSKEALKYDWGTISGLPSASNSGTWRTLTKAEWTYLLNTRTSSTVSGTANARYLKCKVADVPGLMIFPDTFTWPTGVGDAPTGSYINDDDLAWESAPSYSATQFTTLEGAGVVFLPAAGIRNGTSVSHVGSIGGYWSSSATSSAYASALVFDGGSVSYANGGYRSTSRSVRLVSVVQ